jgi:predicted component of type VI protein secretion system
MSTRLPIVLDEREETARSTRTAGAGGGGRSGGGGGYWREGSWDGVELNIGRTADNDLVLPKGNVSKHHARLVFHDGQYVLSDLNSTNGTYVNRVRIKVPTVMYYGDRIYIGDFVLRFEVGPER